MSATTPQIQQLLEAESKAQDIVKDARAYRTARLKASKTDAVAEVNKYKDEKEKEFAAGSHSAESSEDQVEKLAEESSKSEIAQLQKSSKANQQKVSDFLVKTLTS